MGFDIRDDIKLFDFGLAKEVHSEDKDENGLYKLTGMTGSPRYMAPEVGLEKPYMAFRAMPIRLPFCFGKCIPARLLLKCTA